MIGYDPTDALTAFTVEGSNSTYVASFANNNDTSYIRMYANSQSNSGFIFGTSNTDLVSPTFVLGYIEENTNTAIPDLVISNHKTGYGGMTDPQFTVDVIGDINFTSNMYYQGSALAVREWQLSTSPGRVYTNNYVGIGAAVPQYPLHINLGAAGIGQTGGETADFNGPISIMHGYNDSYRFISALDNTMVADDTRYITLGKTIGPHQQAELSYNHIADNSPNNYLGLGLWGGKYCAVTGGGKFGIGTMAPNSKLQCNGGATIGAGFSNAAAAGANTLLVSGSIGIGTDNPQVSIHTTGDVQVASLRAYGEIVSFSDMSDFSLKESFTPLTESLHKLESITPLEFNWKTDIFHAPRAGTRDVGLVAQEVEKVFPLVSGTIADPKNPDITFKTVKYEKLVPYLIQAVQELSARVKALERDRAGVEL
jgi:hypothetical protein